MKIVFSLHVKEYAYDNKYMRSLITRAVCIHTVYDDNWILVIIHFGHIIFDLHNTLYRNCSSGITYITYLLTILSIKICLVLHKYCSKTPLEHDDARDSIISSNCRIRNICKLTASVYLLFFFIVDCDCVTS